MNILSFKTGHDPAACLMVNGKIVAAAEEERFIRKKHANKVFPKNAIEFCLKKADIKPEKIDAVALGQLFFDKSKDELFQYWLSDEEKFQLCMPHSFRQLQSKLKDDLLHKKGEAPYQKEIHELLGRPVVVYDYDHHLSHAASAYFASPFTDAVVLTYDGKGDGTSTAIWHGKSLYLQLIKRFGIAESLGSLYSVLTGFLGFMPNDGEYKVMGLAAYGQPNIDVSGLFDVDENNIYRVDPRFTLPTLEYMKKRFGEPGEGEKEKLSDFHINLAASFQKQLEKVCIHVVKEAVKLTGCRNVCIAGGVGLNIKVNQVILESGVCDHLWVQPAAGDMGNVLGASYLTHVKLKQERPQPMTTLYYGPDFKETEIESALKARNISYEKLDRKELVGTTADLIADGKIVGWFQEEMEFGPRALGHRSILADPRKESMRDKINLKIKLRESFRPFCPSILQEYIDQFMVNYQSAPYMIQSFTATDLAKQQIPAAVHVDGTIRPQEVCLDRNGLYYELIKAFYQKTGVPAVINTSMNVRGEPIVCTPEDAINFYLHTSADVLVIGCFICIKGKGRDSL